MAERAKRKRRRSAKIIVMPGVERRDLAGVAADSGRDPVRRWLSSFATPTKRLPIGPKALATTLGWESMRWPKNGPRRRALLLRPHNPHRLGMTAEIVVLPVVPVEGEPDLSNVIFLPSAISCAFGEPAVPSFSLLPPTQVKS